MRIACLDGSILKWTSLIGIDLGSTVSPGLPVPITVSVSPARPGQLVIVEFRVDGGSIQRLTALPEPADPQQQERLFRVVIPPQTSGAVEYLPVLFFQGSTLSPTLQESRASFSGYQVATSPRPQWGWGWNFLGTLTARLRKELVGPTPEGLRINWHVVEGCFIGPGMEATICPGATDWMRIREDGVGIVEVRACFQTRSGVRIYGSYSGVFDLGIDGYARALRDEYDPMPPVVVAPTYSTADHKLAWLNRAQCFGVGRVDFSTLQVSFDVYHIEVGGRFPSDGSHESQNLPCSNPSPLPARLQGRALGQSKQDILP